MYTFSNPLKPSHTSSNIPQLSDTFPFLQSFPYGHVFQDALKTAAEEHLKKQLSKAGVIDLESGLPWLQDRELVFGVKSSSHRTEGCGEGV